MNQKGQALIEAVLIVPLSIVFFIFIIQTMLYASVEFAIDDAMENYLLCEVQNKSNCKNLLVQNLNYLPLQSVSTSFKKSGHTYEVKFKGLVLRFFHAKKTRKLEYATEI